MNRLSAWLDRRVGMQALLAHFRAERIPSGRRSVWYYLGGLSLMLFAVQVVTGLLLAFYYQPGSGAHASVVAITESIPFGRWVRSLHAASSNLMIGVVLLHMATVFFLKAYRAPRELTWLSGFVLAGLAASFGFTGYLLPMDEMAYAAAGVSLGIVERVPLVGSWVVDTLLGGGQVGETTVRRFFVFHTMLLPLMFCVIVAFHLLQVHRHGIARPAAGSVATPAVPFFPDFVRRELVLWVGVFGLLSAVATVAPVAVTPAADPLASPTAGVHPEWYFMASYQALRLAGRVVPGAAGDSAALLLLLAVALLCAMAPWLDPRSEARTRARTVTAVGVVIVSVFAGLTLLGYVDR